MRGNSVAKPKQGAVKSAQNPGRQPPEVIELPAPRVTGESSPIVIHVDHDIVVLDTIARELDVQREVVTGDVDLHIDLGLGDDQIPQLLSAMGEALDVRFPDDFFDGVSTVAQLTAAVRVSLGPL